MDREGLAGAAGLPGRSALRQAGQAQLYPRVRIPRERVVRGRFPRPHRVVRPPGGTVRFGDAAAARCGEHCRVTRHRQGRSAVNSGGGRVLNLTQSASGGCSQPAWPPQRATIGGALGAVVENKPLPAGPDTDPVRANGSMVAVIEHSSRRPGDVVSDDGQLRITRLGDEPWLFVAGEIDEDSYKSLIRTLASLARDPSEIHIDLADVEYCDVAGLRAFVVLAAAPRRVHAGARGAAPCAAAPGQRPAHPGLGHDMPA